MGLSCERSSVAELVDLNPRLLRLGKARILCERERPKSACRGLPALLKRNAVLKRTISAPYEAVTDLILARRSSMRSRSTSQ